MSNLRIEVTGVEEREVVSKKTGEIMKFREQTAFCHGALKYPFAIKFDVPKNSQPYPPGMYELAPENFYSGDFGKLSIKGQLLLKPILSATKVA